MVTSGLVRPHQLEEMYPIFEEHGLRVTLTKDISQDCLQGGEIAMDLMRSQDQDKYPMFVEQFQANYDKLVKRVEVEKSMRVMVVCFQHIDMDIANSTASNL